LRFQTPYSDDRAEHLPYSDDRQEVERVAKAHDDAFDIGLVMYRLSRAAAQDAEGEDDRGDSIGDVSGFQRRAAQL
jgi:hypothetical protein